MSQNNTHITIHIINNLEINLQLIVHYLIESYIDCWDFYAKTCKTYIIKTTLLVVHFFACI